MLWFATSSDAWQVYGKHALRNAVMPLLTLLGLDCAALMSGVVLTVDPAANLRAGKDYAVRIER